MFTRSSFRNLKHKAKKSVMLKIGKTESSQEDPAFKELLLKIDQVKIELRDMQKTSRSLIITGKQYNDNLERFCGVLKGENLFNNEVVFLQVLEESVCPALSIMINKDLEQLSDLIVEYKMAKLNFDAAHFKAVKDIKKKGVDVSAENAVEVKVDTNLPELKDLYIASKDNLICERDAFLNRLNTNMSKSLKELREASDSKHHQLYCQYFKDKLVKVSMICADGNTDTSPRNSNFSYPENDIVAGLLVEDEKRNQAAFVLGQKTTTVKTDLNGVDQSDFVEVKNNEVSNTAVSGSKPPRLGNETSDNHRSPLKINSVYSNRSRSPTRKKSL